MIGNPYMKNEKDVKVNIKYSKAQLPQGILDDHWNKIIFASGPGLAWL